MNANELFGLQIRLKSLRAKRDRAAATGQITEAERINAQVLRVKELIAASKAEVARTLHAAVTTLDGSGSSTSKSRNGCESYSERGRNTTLALIPRSAYSSRRDHARPDLLNLSGNDATNATATLRSLRPQLEENSNCRHPFLNTLNIHKTIEAVRFLPRARQTSGGAHD
jgi:hypothetical protein